jgi:hypothetical protein
MREGETRETARVKGEDTHEKAAKAALQSAKARQNEGSLARDRARATLKKNG